MIARALSRLALIGTCFVSLGCVAHAEELPQNGDFRITYIGTNPNPPKTVMLDEHRTLSAGVNLLSAVNEDGKGLLQGMNGKCGYTAIVDSAANTFENHGYCDYVDAAGDHVFEKYDYEMQPLGPKYKAAGTWTGGTGKFKGLSGSFSIESTRFAASDSVPLFMGVKSGHYEIAPSSSASR